MQLFDVFNLGISVNGNAKNINFSIGGLKIRIRMGNNLKVRIAARNNRGLCDVPVFLARIE